jgi:hypothetical protein
MRWLIALDDRDDEVTREFDGTEEEARKVANDLFDGFVSDTGREYDYPEDVPVVIIHEIGKSIGIDMAARYFKGVEEDKKFYQEQRERQEREQFERLQKKFGQK